MSSFRVPIVVLGRAAFVERVRAALDSQLFDLRGQRRTDTVDAVLLTDDEAVLAQDPRLPVVLVSSSWTPRLSAIFRSGAADVLLDGVSDAELSAHVERAWLSFREGRSASGRDDVLPHLPDGALVLTREGRLVSLNVAGRAILGWPDVAPGASWRTLAAPVDEPGTDALFRNASRGERILHAGLDVILRTGQRVSLAVSVGRLPSSGHFLVSFRDVTAERVTEAELRRTSEFLHHLIDSSSDAIIAADLKGRLLVYNRASERMFGVPANEALERSNVADLYPQGGAREVMRLLRESATGHIEAVRTYGKSAAGELIPIEISASLLKMKGQEIASVGVLRDMRERVRVEAELSRTRARLMDAEKQREITALAGATAHELNQPLTVIVGRVELLLRRLDGAHRVHVQAIAEQAERMTEIVKRIAKLTHVRTMPYAGDLQIADLDSPEAQPQRSTGTD